MRILTLDAQDDKDARLGGNMNFKPIEGYKLQYVNNKRYNGRSILRCY